MKKLEETTLENNMRIIQQKRKHDVALIAATVRAGSQDESKTTNGMFHAIEHMLGRSNSNFDQVMGDIGAYHNFMTSFGTTTYYAIIPKRDIAETIKLFAKMLFESTFKEKEWNIEKENIISEIGDAKRHFPNVVDEERHKILMNNPPYSFSVLGTEKTVKQMDVETLQQCYDTYYQPMNVWLTTSGEVPLKTVSSIFETYTNKRNIPQRKVSPIPTKKVIKTIVQGTAPQRVKRRISVHPKNPTFTQWGYALPTTDTKEYIASKIISEYIGAPFWGILHKKVRNEEGGTYHVSTNIRHAGRINHFTLQTSTEYKKAEQIEKFWLDALQRTKNISAKDLERTKRRLEGVFEIEMNAIGLVYAIEQAQQEQDMSSVNDYIKKVNEITVTDIKQTIRNYFGDEYVKVQGIYNKG